jgi:hypothetical protein
MFNDVMPAAHVTLSARIKPLRRLTLFFTAAMAFFALVGSLAGGPLVWSTPAGLRYLATVVLGGAMYFAAAALSRQVAPEYPARVNPLTMLRLVGASQPGVWGVALSMMFFDDGTLFLLVGAATSIVALLVGVFPRESILPDYRRASAANGVEHVGDNPAIERG